MEYNSSGHHLFYVRLLAEALLERGHTPVIVTSQRARTSSEWAVHLQLLESRLEIVTRGQAHLTLLELRRTIDAFPGALAIVPHGDLLATSGLALFALRGRRVRMLIMRDRARVPRMPVLSPLKTAVKRLQLRVADAVPGVELVLLRPSTARDDRSGRVALDPVSFDQDVEATHLVTTRLAEAGQPTHWVGVLGAITRRKNVPLVAAAVAMLPAGEVGLVVAGRVLPESMEEVRAARQVLEGSGHYFLLDDRDLPDAELDGYVAAVDAVVLAHSNEGPSGLFGKSLVAATPILAAGARSLRLDAAERPEAAVWVPLDADAVAAALPQVLALRPAADERLTSTHFVSAMLDDQVTRQQGRRAARRR